MPIRVNELSFSYEGKSILKDISFSANKGDFLAILGPNGAGKTTLMKLLLGFLTPDAGTIEILGSKRPDKIRKKIGYVPQRFSIDRQFPATVRELFQHASTSRSFQSLCDHLGLEGFLDQQFISLSGGQQQRVLIGLALLREPEVLILDEPTVGVDRKTQESFYSLLKHLNKTHHLTILLVTHDVGMVPAVAKHVLCINHTTCCFGEAKDAEHLLSDMYPTGHHPHHHH